MFFSTIGKPEDRNMDKSLTLGDFPDCRAEKLERV
jgi:hypothetical protein